MEKNKGRADLGLKEKGEHEELKAVEGTGQCERCQRYMKLGEARLCLTVKSRTLEIAEIVAWLPGRCDRFIEASSPFERIGSSLN